jgi:hypothetical protein
MVCPQITSVGIFLFLAVIISLLIIYYKKHQTLTRYIFVIFILAFTLTAFSAVVGPIIFGFMGYKVDYSANISAIDAISCFASSALATLFGSFAVFPYKDQNLKLIEAPAAEKKSFLSRLKFW